MPQYSILIDERISDDSLPTATQDRPSGSCVPLSAAHADRLLVDRCLTGEVAAWEELYCRYHVFLCDSIKSLLRLGSRDANLIDEIAARVWYLLIKNDGDLLDRFDPEWGLRLASFLRGLARIEMMQYFRADRRRQARETEASRRSRISPRISDGQFRAMLQEFLATLTPGEQRFLEDYLLLSPSVASDRESPELSDANIWQRRHRIRVRLLAFFRDDD